MSETCGLGWTVGPGVAPELGGSAGALERFEDRGGGRLGYLRAALVAEYLPALFAALDVALPILG